MELYAHTARYTGMTILILIFMLAPLALTYILYKRRKERNRREQEAARRKKDDKEAFDEYCRRFGNPYTAD